MQQKGASYVLCIFFDTNLSIIENFPDCKQKTRGHRRILRSSDYPENRKVSEEFTGSLSAGFPS